MSRQDRIDMHKTRAFDELECARQATSMAAAEAHLALSEMHLRMIRTLSEVPRPALRLVRPGESLDSNLGPAAALVDRETADDRPAWEVGRS